jgi:hypothetical protein
MQHTSMAEERDEVSKEKGMYVGAKNQRTRKRQNHCEVFCDVLNIPPSYPASSLVQV